MYWTIATGLAALLFAASADARPPLVDAAKQADWNLVRTLVERDPDVNAARADGSTALHWAYE